MKIFFRFPVLVLFVTGFAFASVPFTVPEFTILELRQLGIEAAVAQTTTVPASLPESANVVLKTGRAIQGKVVGFDASRQILTLQGDSTHVLSMGDIERIYFSATATALDGNGRPILRGEGGPSGSPVTWNPVAISGLQFNQTYGTAQIILGSSVSNPGQPNHTYVLNELRFNPQQGTMAVTATPY